MKEAWKDVPGYEGLYQVSNLGRVKSLPRKVRCNAGWRITKEQILKPHQSNSGYLRVIFAKNGKLQNISIHRSVAQLFISNPHNYTEVNHKDENKHNNRASNLEWCTPKHNINYGSCLARRSKAREKPVLQLTLDNKLIKRWPSAVKCERLGFNRANICSCCRGKRKTAYGYKWRYANAKS